MNRDAKLTSLKDVEIALRPFVPLVSQLTGKDTVLDRIRPLMDGLGNPQKKLKTIHIAGTSGKTSTAYYIAGLLHSKGLKVGLTVSPHIDKISERVQVNGKCLEDAVFCQEIELFLRLVKKSGIKPSYFELMYAFAIWLLAKYEVDYAVVETGVGGLYDATNILDNTDKVCVLTDIGYDHMHLLGNTLEEITDQKVGIVHEGNHLLMYKQARSIMGQVERWLGLHNAFLELTSEEEEAKLYGGGPNFDNLPDYQKRNWLLAYFVCRFVAKRDGLGDFKQTKLWLSQKIVIPARMDETTVSGKLLIMDGAHNQQKIAAFVSSFKHKYPSVKPNVLLAFKTGKDYLKALPLIIDFANQIILTTFETSQDLPVTSVDPYEVAAALKECGFTSRSVEPDMKKAYNKLVSSDNQTLVITGSFYLISQLRENEIKIA